MKHRLPITIAVTALALGFAGSVLVRSQAPAASQRYEVAVIKWDGPDKVQYILPDRTEYVRLLKENALPKDIHDEEYCMMLAGNHLAREGWEPVNLNATRMLLKRPVR